MGYRQERIKQIGQVEQGQIPLVNGRHSVSEFGCDTRDQTFKGSEVKIFRCPATVMGNAERRVQSPATVRCRRTGRRVHRITSVRKPWVRPRSTQILTRHKEVQDDPQTVLISLYSFR
jgi:hypothetical protein